MSVLVREKGKLEMQTVEREGAVGAPDTPEDTVDIAHTYNKNRQLDYSPTLHYAFEATVVPHKIN